ncbi:hypothetical protein LK09_00840 [Microbacterium mangrovi]|uniref:Gram-positive cocci surface proteins LPxTG domain-containing protein n=1 Tax=Microbacterium mangrovi TaxID=1348253 RepID=A0A0B2ADX3_9MICO|nr:hypothetical protein [Microbacterium mangrovi]KHK99910.1 hypothetical protein LK09_00840 [Microbacterium mangrovi]
MKEKTRTRLRVAGTAAALVAGSVALAAPAMAATAFPGYNVADSKVDASPGDQVTLHWSYWNAGSSDISGITGGQAVFHAPKGTSFVTQSSVKTEYAKNGGILTPAAQNLSGCTLSDANATLTCQVPGGWNWPADVIFRFDPKVVVADDAAAGTYSAAADVTLTAAGGTYTIDDGTLDVNIIAAAGAPVVEPGGLAVAGGAAAVAAAGIGTMFVVRRRKQPQAD